jgi:hypothetical protein
MESARQIRQDLRKYWKRRVCLWCGAMQDAGDKGCLCSRCHSKKAATQARRERDHWCVKCGGKGVWDTGKKCCPTCREKARIRAAERRQTARAARV